MLEHSFQHLSEIAVGAPSLGASIVGVQLDELRALSDAYAAPLLEIGDAVPLRGALRLDAASAIELADTPSLSSRSAVGTRRLGLRARTRSTLNHAVASQRRRRRRSLSAGDRVHAADGVSEKVARHLGVLDRAAAV